MVERCRRRAGILGMAVTASKAATAGGSALASWLWDERADRPLCSPRILVVCVEDEDLMGVRSGMPTGLDMVVEEGACVGGCSGDGVCWQLDMVGFLFIGCVCVSTAMGLVLRGDGLDRMRVPILSDEDLEERGEGGEGCR